MNETIVRLNARIANQREELRHKEFVLGRIRRENGETLHAIDKLLFLALTLPEAGQRVAAIEAAQGIAAEALDASAIEARSDATGTGAAEGESAPAGDAQ